MNWWRSFLIVGLITLPLHAAIVTAIWSATFRTLGWPMNWRLLLDPFMYWQWIARQAWPGQHEILLPEGTSLPLPLRSMRTMCRCGRRRCSEVTRK